MDKGKIKRIGVLTSGGDAPGMNAAVRSVVRSASESAADTTALFPATLKSLARKVFHA